MKVILEIDDAYANVLSVTAVGCGVFETKVSATAADLSKHRLLRLGADGKWAVESEVQDEAD